MRTDPCPMIVLDSAPDFPPRPAAAPPPELGREAAAGDDELC